MKDGKNFVGGWDKVITEQFKVIKTKEQTNEEWFCGLSTEDKAVFLSVEAARAISEYEDNDTKRTGMNFWKYWLKAVHKE